MIYKTNSYNKNDKLLVYSLTGYALWWFLTGFEGFKGGWGDIVRQLHINPIIPFYLLFVFIYCSTNKSLVFRQSNQKNAFILLLGFFLCFFLTIFSSGVLPPISIIVCPFIASIFLMLHNDIKLSIFDKFIRALSILLLLSSVEWLLYRTTGIGVVIGDVTREFVSYKQLLLNYIPYARTDIYDNFYAIDMFRFQSLAEEPGLVGTVCGLLLYSTTGNRKYRFQHIVFWIAGFLSFSLAFYILALGSLALYLNRRKAMTLFLGIAVIVLVLITYNYDSFSSLILDRIMSSDHGDNRVDSFFQSEFIATWNRGDLWFGHCFQLPERMAGNNAGAKVAIYEYGIVGVLCLVFAYTAVYIDECKRIFKRIPRETLVFLLFFWASYYQRQTIEHFEYVVIFFSMPYVFGTREKTRKN